MKTKGLLNLGLIALIAIAFVSCGPFGKMKPNADMVKYTVTPSPLEMHAGEVVVNVSGKFPEKYFDKKAELEIVPVIKWEGGEVALPAVKLQGEKVQANNKVIKTAEGGSFSYNEKVPYQEGMRKAVLEVRIKAKKGSKEVVFDPKKIADGVMATASLVETDAKVIGAKDNFVRITSETKNADVLFQMQRAEIRPTELKEQDIKDFLAYIQEIKKDTAKLKLKDFTLEAYASPDGGVDLNKKLTDSRAKSTKDNFTKEFKKLKEAADPNFYKVESKGQDWEGFQQLMKASDIADRELIIRVLSMYSDPEVRNREMKNMSKTFKEVAEKVLPKLRRSNFKVNVDVVGKSDAQLLAYSDTAPQKLNVEELLFAATLKPDADSKLKVYESCSSIHKDDWRAFNNAGVILFEKGNIAEAKVRFENAKAAKANSAVFNNLGACAIKENDFAKAEELFASASGAGKELDYNLGILAIRKAQYKEAVSYFGAYNTANAAIAKILAGNVDDALKTLDNADKKDDAMVLYVKAICGARKANTEIMFNNLRSAIAKKADLSKLAKVDIEFAKYYEDDTFKTIAK